MRTMLDVVLATTALMWGLEGVAQACSGSDCLAPKAVPQGSVEMPANAVGLAWYSGDAAVEDVVLLDVEAGVELEIAVDNSASFVGLYPAQALAPGRQYTFEIPSGTCGPGFAVHVSTTSAVELDGTALGSLIVSSPEYTDVPIPASPTCTYPVAAVLVQFELDLAPELEPFAKLLMYETFVDGVRWDHQPSLYSSLHFGSSWIGRGVDAVFSTCPESSHQNGLTQGVHQVQMIARIPGIPGLVLESDVAEVLLECEASEPGETGDLGEETGDESGETGSSAVPVDSPDSQTCACTSASGRAWPLGWLLLLGLGVARRRPMGRRRGC